MRFATAALLAMFPIALSAQAQARVSGTMRDTAGTPIGDVGVLLMPGNRHARTDAAGRFAFDSVTAARHTLNFRRLGFLPLEVALNVAATRDTILELKMIRRPRLLDTVVVTARGCSKTNFDGFLCRRTTIPGIFLTEADIQAKNPRYLADVFQGIEGFQLEMSAGPYGPSRKVRAAESRCVTTLWNGRPPVMSDMALDASSTMQGAAFRTYSENDFYRPADLIGVEIYPPGYKTPIEYLSLKQVRASAGGYKSAPGSMNTPKARRVEAPQESCVLVNYWTAEALRNPNGGLLGLLRRVF
jgi:hypothetical protein